MILQTLGSVSSKYKADSQMACVDQMLTSLLVGESVSVSAFLDAWGKDISITRLRVMIYKLSSGSSGMKVITKTNDGNFPVSIRRVK